MKRLFISLVMGGGMLTLPLLTQATINLPEDAVGVTESTFSQLKEVDGSACDFDNQDDCDSYEELLTNLFDQIIFRAEDKGQMYRVVKEGAGPVTVYVDRWLPDGMYRSKGSVFWVANGYKTILKKGEAYDRIVERASQDPQAIVPVNEETFFQYYYSCDQIREDWGDKEDVPFYQHMIDLCDQGLTIGQWTKDGFQGKMLLCVNDAELYYISSEGHMLEVYEKLEHHSMRYALKVHAEKVGKNVENNIPRYPSSYPDRY